MRRLLLLLFALTLFVFSDVIIAHVVSWKLGTVIDCESCEIEQGILKLESASLGGIRAKRLFLKPIFHPFSWTLELKGAVIEPDIELSQKDVKHKSRFIKVDWNLALIDGKLHLADGTTLSAFGTARKGKMHLEASSATSHMGIDLIRSKEKTQLALDLHNIEFHVLEQLLPKRKWTLEDGIVNGQATLVWEKGKRPIVEGHLSIENASAQLFPWSIGSISGEFSFVDQTVSLNIVGAFGHGDQTCRFFASELPTGEISLTVEGPMKALTPFLPNAYRKVFTDETFAVEAKVCHIKEFTADGTLTIDETLVVPFGVSEGIVGHFSAKQVDVSKYISPLIKDVPHFSGTVDLTATFNAKQVEINYNGRNVVLESDLFKITAPTIENATHTFGLNGNQSGLIPLQNATYLEKKTDLLFEKATCQVTLEDEAIHINDVETYCNDVQFKGSVLVNTPKETTNHFFANATSIDGSIFGAQQILSHVCDGALWNFPAEGNIDGTLDLDILFTHPCQVNCSIAGSIQDATLGPLQQIQTALTYEQEGRILTLNDLSANVGNTEIENGTLAFTNFPEGNIDFSLNDYQGTFEALEDGSRQLITDDIAFFYDASGASLQTKKLKAHAIFDDGISLFITTPFELNLAHVQLKGSEILAETNYDNETHAIAIGLEGNDVRMSVSDYNLYWDTAPLLTRIESPSCFLVRDHRASTSETDVFYGTAQYKGYDLSGTFSAPKADPKALSFEGKISAQNFSFHNYNIERMAANLSYSPTKLALTDLFAQDPIGNLRIPSIEGGKQEKIWHFDIPLIAAGNITPNNDSRIVIDYAEIHDITGTSEGAHTFTGEGQLTFHNPPKRDLRGTILALPDDLLGVIGLDFGCFIPASGQVDYRLQDGKVHFTAFNNVYSHAERSQFYLDKHLPSTMDLSGNLDLKVRMRHYNILLKLTEGLTVVVEGNIKEPSFRILQQE